jgi:Domain of unknown function (DUF4253)
MIESLEDINKLLVGTELENSCKVVVEICEGSKCAFAIKVKAENCLRAWGILRALLDKTERYPLIFGYGESTSEDWARNLAADEDLFSRRGFEYEYSGSVEEEIDVSPQAIVERAKAVDIAQEIQHIPQEESYFSLVEVVDVQLNVTLAGFGIAPQKETILNALLDNPNNTSLTVEKWLFDWEREHLDPEIALASPDLGYLYLDWYGGTWNPNLDLNDGNYTLILLPTSHSWEALAYIHWFGADRASNNSEKMIALLQSWHERFKAELVAHDGLNLLFDVHHRPTTPEEAFQLAVEHEFFAQDTLVLPGISVRDHARALLHIDRWCLSSNY